VCNIIVRHTFSKGRYNQRFQGRLVRLQSRNNAIVAWTVSGMRQLERFFARLITSPEKANPPAQQVSTACAEVSNAARSGANSRRLTGLQKKIASGPFSL
jgi:hypothetical protein